MTFDESLHPRQDGGPNPGQFAPKQQDGPSGTLVRSEPVRMDGLSDDESEEVCEAYAEVATWSSTVMAGNYNRDEQADDYELSPQAEHTLREEAAKAWNTMPEDLRETVIEDDVDLSQWGHDMWLTREGHGAGFWDREDHVYGSAETRDKLDEHARQAGEGGYFWLDDTGVMQYERM